MRSLQTITLVAAMLAALPARTALATDQPLPGTRLLVLDQVKLSLLSEASSISVPLVGGPDDPTSVGGTLMIYNPTSGESATFSLPASNWKSPRRGGSFKFVNRNAPAPPSEVKLALLKNGRQLKVRARRSGVTLDEPSQGSLGVVLTTGSQRYCVLFGGTVAVDRPGTFVARNAPAPASCPSVPSTTTTTVMLTTTTTARPSTTTSSTTTTSSSSTTTRPPTTTTLPPCAMAGFPACQGSCSVGRCVAVGTACVCQ